MDNLSIYSICECIHIQYMYICRKEDVFTVLDLSIVLFSILLLLFCYAMLFCFGSACLLISAAISVLCSHLLCSSVRYGTSYSLLCSSVQIGTSSLQTLFSLQLKIFIVGKVHQSTLPCAPNLYRICMRLFERLI